LPARAELAALAGAGLRDDPAHRRAVDVGTTGAGGDAHRREEAQDSHRPRV
jgi:hypothetical protein